MASADTASTEGDLDVDCRKHITSTGMNMKKYKKIASFLDKIMKTADTKDEKTLVDEFAKKCYANYKKDDGLRQARKFLKVLFGDNLTTLVKQGCTAALKAAANSSPNVMRIVRLNKPVDGFHKKLTKYYIGATLGKGATSVVKLGRDEETGREVAIKILTGGNFKQEDLKKEIDILKQFKHPNVIQLYDCYENVDFPGHHKQGKPTTVIVLELATKGELFDFFMYTGKFEPPLARWFFKQMLEGVDYCHKNGVSHRDLKPENCLLGDGYVVKLVDFGFATNFVGDAGTFKMQTALGTPGYAAPEIMKRQKYTKAVDIFSLGVILFITIAGFPPFQEAKDDGSDWWFDKLKKKKYALFWKAHERTATFTQEAKDLLIGMLTADPKDRWTVKQIKESKWWKGDTLSQKAAVAALLKRKGKVEIEKISKDAAPLAKGVNRAVSDTVHAPAVGAYRPPNAFFCVPSVNAATIRATLMDKIVENFMGKVEKLYEITGTSTKPDPPDDFEENKESEGDWNPWYDLSFTCTMKSQDDETPLEFEGTCTIREDTSYVPPEENPGFRRHIVWFKKQKGRVHKWWQMMYMLQMSVGFFHTQGSKGEEMPKVSPMKLGPPPTDLGEDEKAGGIEA